MRPTPSTNGWPTRRIRSRCSTCPSTRRSGTPTSTSTVTSKSTSTLMACPRTATNSRPSSTASCRNSPSSPNAPPVTSSTSSSNMLPPLTPALIRALPDHLCCRVNTGRAGGLGRSDATAGVPDRCGASPDDVLPGSAEPDGEPAAGQGAIGVAVGRGLLPRGGVREPVGQGTLQRGEDTASLGKADAEGAQGAGPRGPSRAGVSGAALLEEDSYQGPPEEVLGGVQL